ncbi:SDR family oxidoreductase [Corallococcus sp. bb12-1]|uniref:SDR family oxidoreductase n=1 Tax=Corallococcus sp. bb12-1 TaxID=2996784 RepID=UPI00226F7285|nr:SDR family oxidoreductase [Corallococcus sp. bb12-1]MCY1046183.1 SDR family oxidoreductase [Corallococcus sp. bb12-1]
MPQTTLVTGSSTGFGRATVRRFARAGWNVIATLRTPEAGREFHGLDNVLVTRLDVQDGASITSAVEAGIARFGAIDALINNAGFGLYGVFESTPREKVAEQFDVNLFGLMDVTRAVLPQMRRQRSGVILNITSGAGVFGVPMSSLYCASKFAVEGFSEALSYELVGMGITVKLIEPGGVLDSQFVSRSGSEAARTGRIEDYAPFLAHADEVFAGLRNTRAGATSDDVAEVIFGAATDGTDQLRYVATPQIQALVKARRETSEAEYLALMRKSFGYRRD